MSTFRPSAELANLQVHGPTTVGWDEQARPNETVDEDGNLMPPTRGFGVPDPRAPRSRHPDDPQVAKLRAHLETNNGINGLDVCAPEEADRAARILRRDGFVVVRDLLSEELLERFREACARVLRDILSIPGRDGRKYVTETGRLPHRYSYGTSSASRQLLHDPVWAGMVDLPTTTPILEKIFGSPDYHVIGAGGDVCLPGAVEYQHLHSDTIERSHLSAGRLEQAKLLGIELRRRADSDELDTGTQRLVIERTQPLVTVNFLMSDLTWENGPIRQIPGTHAMQQRPPSPIDEPEWMRLSTLVGAKAGWGVFRDNRAWHGATPNLGREVRAMPNVEYSPGWAVAEDHPRTMPHDIWLSLTPYGQHICRRVKADPGDWPAGAGVMHPLHHERQTAAGRDPNRHDPPS